MQDVSQGEGRTVLFVSHNMDAIQRLCSRCVMLERGQLIANSDTATAIQQYISKNFHQSAPNQWIDLTNASRQGTGEAKFIGIQYSSLNDEVAFYPYPDGSLEILLNIESDLDLSVGSLAVSIYNQSGNLLVNADTVLFGQIINFQKGKNRVKLIIEKLHLKAGIYVLGLWLDKTGKSASGREALDHIESAFEIEVVEIVSEGIGEQIIGPVTCNFRVLSNVPLSC